MTYLILSAFAFLWPYFLIIFKIYINTELKSILWPNMRDLLSSHYLGLCASVFHECLILCWLVLQLIQSHGDLMNDVLTNRMKTSHINRVYECAAMWPSSGTSFLQAAPWDAVLLSVSVEQLIDGFIVIMSNTSYNCLIGCERVHSTHFWFLFSKWSTFRTNLHQSSFLIAKIHGNLNPTLTTISAGSLRAILFSSTWWSFLSSIILFEQYVHNNSNQFCINTC